MDLASFIKVIVGDKADVVMPLLSGLMDKGENNFIDAVQQCKGLFATKQDMIDCIAYMWDKTTGAGATSAPVFMSSPLIAFLKIINDSANFVDGVRVIKATFTKEQFLVVVAEMWDKGSPYVGGLVVIPPAPTPIPSPEPPPKPCPPCEEKGCPSCGK